MDPTVENTSILSLQITHQSFGPMMLLGGGVAFGVVTLGDLPYREILVYLAATIAIFGARGLNGLLRMSIFAAPECPSGAHTHSRGMPTVLGIPEGSSSKRRGSVVRR